MEHIKQLIDAIIDGNIDEADKIFDSVLVAKTEEGIDGLASFVEENLFEERISELKSTTLGSYINKAATSIKAKTQVGKNLDNIASSEYSKAHKAEMQGDKESAEKHTAIGDMSRKSAAEFDNEVDKRRKGIAMSTNKIVARTSEGNE